MYGNVWECMGGGQIPPTAGSRSSPVSSIQRNARQKHLAAPAAHALYSPLATPECNGGGSSTSSGCWRALPASQTFPCPLKSSQSIVRQTGVCPDNIVCILRLRPPPLYCGVASGRYGCWRLFMREYGKIWESMREIPCRLY